MRVVDESTSETIALFFKRLSLNILALIIAAVPPFTGRRGYQGSAAPVLPVDQQTPSVANVPGCGFGLFMLPRQLYEERVPLKDGGHELSTELKPWNRSPMNEGQKKMAEPPPVDDLMSSFTYPHLMNSPRMT